MGHWTPDSGITPFVRKYFSIILIIAALVVTAGAFSGYTTYVLSDQSMADAVNDTCDENLAGCIVTLGSCKENMTECEGMKEDLDQLSTLATNLQDRLYAFQQSNTELQSKVDEYEDRIEQYLAEIDDLNSDLDSAEASVEELNNSLTDLEDQFEDLQTEHDAILQNAANRICCVQRVYNPDLKYYYLSEFEIVCTSEASEELDTKEFIC
jgi:peptidoglycan hydrolase CwlO-like protein